MKEKIPEFQRPEPVIVGPASPERKQKVKQMILERFGERHYEQLTEEQRQILESLEYEKKDYEKLAIKQANEITDSFLQKFGLRSFNIPERKIHIWNP